MVLNDICEVYSGYALKEFNDVGEGLPVIKIGNILTDGTLNLEECQYTTECVNEKYYSKNNDVYVALSGATTGKIGIIKSEDRFIINQRVGIVRKKNNDVPNEFIKYFLLRQTDRILQEAAGCAQPNISPKQLGQYEIPVYDDSKMQHIVMVLDNLSKIMHKRNDELSSLDNLIKARFVELFEDRVFEKKQLIELIQEGAGLSYGIVVPGDNVPDGIPMVRPSDYKNGRLNLDNAYRVASDIECKYKKTRLIGDEILVQVIGQPGQVMLCDERCKGMNVTRNLAVVRIDKDKAERLFISHYLTTEEAQCFMCGSTNQ